MGTADMSVVNESGSEVTVDDDEEVKVQVRIWQEHCKRVQDASVLAA